MNPHFLKDEEYVFPPLGILKSLAAGEDTEERGSILIMTSRLKATFSEMLEEHRSIQKELKALAEAIQEGDRITYFSLPERILLHLKAEEEVFYPAALLIGEYLRERKAGW